MPRLLSVVSRIFSLAMGVQKLGQPVPDSNLVSALKRAVSQQMQRKTPFRSALGLSFVKGGSVAEWRVTAKASDESCLFHSASDLMMRSTATVETRWPSSVNWTMVTVLGR